MTTWGEVEAALRETESDEPMTDEELTARARLDVGRSAKAKGIDPLGPPDPADQSECRVPTARTRTALH